MPNELYGKGAAEARALVSPLLEQLDQDQTLQIFQTLIDLLGAEQKWTELLEQKWN